MKRIIFTVWDDIEREDDTWNVNHWSHEQQKDYWDKLIGNKKDFRSVTTLAKNGIQT